MISLAPIIAAAMCASGARSPDAPTEPWAGTTGIKSALEQGLEHGNGLRPDARGALGQARELERHHQPNDRRGRCLAHAGRMRQHDVALQGLEVAVAIRTLASLPKPVLMP